jgi:hypothetical protein
VKIDNLIVIKGGAYNDIKKALNQWIKLYSDRLEDNWVFKLFKNGRGNHIIQADTRLDNQGFYCLVNYLKYPEDIEYSIQIEGFTTGKDKNQLQGKELNVYISPTDQEYDNVFVTTSNNQNYKIDFSGRIEAGGESKTYNYPQGLQLAETESITVSETKNTLDEDEDSTGNPEKRFKIISGIILLSLMIVLALDKETLFFKESLKIISIAVMTWFLHEYKALQIDKYYYRFIGLGLVVFVYGVLLSKYFGGDTFVISDLTTLPFLMLIIQRPLRLAFIKLIKREPEIKKPYPSFADFVYTLLLLALPFITMLILF